MAPGLYTDPYTGHELIHARGTGGARFDLDVPVNNTHALERFVQRLLNGDLIAVDDDGHDVERGALIDAIDPEYLFHPAPPGTVVDDDAEVELDAMKIAELRAYAAAHDIELGDAKKKDEILEIVRFELEQRAAGDPDANN